jgi:hypothetical protein
MTNWSKSGIVFSKRVDNQTKHDIQNVFPVPIMDETFIHLGHPLVLPAKKEQK